jgi:hypothetical protein
MPETATLPEGLKSRWLFTQAASGMWRFTPSPVTHKCSISTGGRAWAPGNPLATCFTSPRSPHSARRGRVDCSAQRRRRKRQTRERSSAGTQTPPHGAREGTRGSRARGFPGGGGGGARARARGAGAGRGRELT